VISLLRSSTNAIANKYTYFAALKGRGENSKVEAVLKWRDWENTFIGMWKKFKVGDFEGATEHWKDYDPQNQKDFLRERRSSRYLDKWLGKM
jgi:hypothetical protein